MAVIATHYTVHIYPPNIISCVPPQIQGIGKPFNLDKVQCIPIYSLLYVSETETEENVVYT